MVYYITSGTGIYTKTFATPNEAINAFKAPSWAGAPEKELETRDDREGFGYRGDWYTVEGSEDMPVGVEPKVWIREQQAKSAQQNKSSSGSKIFSGLRGFEEGEEG